MNKLCKWSNQKKDETDCMTQRGFPKTRHSEGVKSRILTEILGPPWGSIFPRINSKLPRLCSLIKNKLLSKQWKGNSPAKDVKFVFILNGGGGCEYNRGHKRWRVLAPEQTQQLQTIPHITKVGIASPLTPSPTPPPPSNPPHTLGYVN